MGRRVAAVERPTGLDAEAIEAVRGLIRVARVMERRAGELGLVHYRVLAAVAAGEERASRVATRLAVGKPAVSAAVAALCARGWLERSERADDQRVAQLALTAQGRAALDEVEGHMASALTGLAARTGRPREVVADLAALGGALDEVLAELGW
jgi:DNA-binding MarR family transcriptional regulator